MRINEGFQDDSGSTVTLKSVTSVIVDELNPSDTSKTESGKWRSKIFQSSDSGIDSGAVAKSSIHGSRSLNGGGTEASSSSGGSSSGDSTVEVESIGARSDEQQQVVGGEDKDDDGGVQEEEFQEKEVIAILGSGDFGRALAGRLVQAGYVVNIGSRDPQRNA